MSFLKGLLIALDHIDEVINYSLEDNERCLVVIKKIKKTEQIYPRNQGKPLKNPIR